MNLSYGWLKEFVDIDVTPKEFDRVMTMSGSKVEGFEIEGSSIENVVVGRVLSIEKHPDADKLLVTHIDTGSGQIQIVTGAKNLTVGDLVPVALDGAKLPGGKQINKGKLRGVESEGMLCSIHELGVTLHDFPYAEDDGIFVLQEPCVPGDDILKAIGLNDIKFEFEITSNRADCFSVIGLAREAAASYKKELKLHTPVVKGGGTAEQLLEVVVDEPDLCPVYAARIVKDVKIEPSPRWMRERLRAMGVRPINNIVDITNYVMLEYGQPMHAFDYRLVDGKKIIVRRADEGERITTLDGIERTLNPANLIIADAQKPIAIAGVMGGEYSGIVDDTAMIVFESANFNAISVRLTAKEQKMRSDASSRFEKSLDPNSCIPALNRACELVEILGAGTVLDNTILSDSTDKTRRVLPFEVDFINKFINLNLTRDEMQVILERVGCEIDGDSILIPTFRNDLEGKADIAEEIARFYGYDNIPSTALNGTADGGYSPVQQFENRLADTMLALGFSEIYTYSFISPKFYDKILLAEDSRLRDSLAIRNPLGLDTSIMRTIAIPSLLEALENNRNNRNPAAALFELATEYLPTGLETLPQEKKSLVMGCYGDGTDFFFLKGCVEAVLHQLGIEDSEYTATGDYPFLHPGRSAMLLWQGEPLGFLGELHPDAAENYSFDKHIYIASLDTEKLFVAQKIERSYSPLPKFPAVTRDLALICDCDLPVSALEKAIHKGAPAILESLSLFDVYQGDQVADGKKSVAYSLVLRSGEGTLTDEKVSAVMSNILAALNGIGASLRT